MLEEIAASEIKDSPSALEILVCVYNSQFCDAHESTFLDGLCSLLKKDANCQHHQVRVSEALARLVDVLSSDDNNPSMRRVRIAKINRSLDLAVAAHVDQGGAFYDCHFLPGGFDMFPAHFYAKHKENGNDITVPVLAPFLTRSSTPATEKSEKDANRIEDVLQHFKAHMVDLQSVTKESIHALVNVSKAAKLELIKQLLPAPPAPPAPIGELLKPAELPSSSASAAADLGKQDAFSSPAADPANEPSIRQKRSAAHSMQPDAVRQRIEYNRKKLKTARPEEQKAIREAINTDLLHKQVIAERPEGLRSVATIQRNIQRARKSGADMTQLLHELMAAKSCEKKESTR